MRQSFLKLSQSWCSLGFGQVHPVHIAFIEAGMGILMIFDSISLSPLAVLCPLIGLTYRATWEVPMLKLQLWEAAGVLKNGAPLFMRLWSYDVRDVFEKKAREEGSKTHELGEIPIAGQAIPRFYLWRVVSRDDIALAMAGQHQATLAWLSWLLYCSKDYPSNPLNS